MLPLYAGLYTNNFGPVEQCCFYNGLVSVYCGYLSRLEMFKLSSITGKYEQRFRSFLVLILSTIKHAILLFPISAKPEKHIVDVCTMYSNTVLCGSWKTEWGLLWWSVRSHISIIPTVQCEHRMLDWLGLMGLSIHAQNQQRALLYQSSLDHSETNWDKLQFLFIHQNSAYHELITYIQFTHNYLMKRSFKPSFFFKFTSKADYVKHINFGFLKHVYRCTSGTMNLSITHCVSVQALSSDRRICMLVSSIKQSC